LAISGEEGKNNNLGGGNIAKKGWVNTEGQGKAPKTPLRDPKGGREEKCLQKKGGGGERGNYEGREMIFYTKGGRGHKELFTKKKKAGERGLKNGRGEKREEPILGSNRK